MTVLFEIVTEFCSLPHDCNKCGNKAEYFVIKYKCFMCESCVNDNIRIYGG